MTDKIYYEYIKYNTTDGAFDIYGRSLSKLYDLNKKLDDNEFYELCYLTPNNIQLKPTFLVQHPFLINNFIILCKDINEENEELIESGELTVEFKLDFYNANYYVNKLIEVLSYCGINVNEYTYINEPIALNVSKLSNVKLFIKETNFTFESYKVLIHYIISIIFPNYSDIKFNYGLGSL